MKRTRFWRLPVLVLALAGLLSCGGGGGTGSLAGAGIGGTGITRGSVTGFGSLFVNGVEFETAGAAFLIDGVPAAGADRDLFRVGQVVTVTGATNPDGLTGSAREVAFEAELEGPVAADPVVDADGTGKTLTILGRPVFVHVDRTNFAGVTFATLARDDVVELSGFLDANGILQATYLEGQGVLDLGTSEVRVKGVVANSDGAGRFELLNTGLAVTFSGGTDVSELPGGVPSDGQFVEVRGVLSAPAEIAAARIEPEDDGLDDNLDEVSLEGIVSDFISLADFRLAGRRVDASAATRKPAGLAVADGVRLEAEGALIGGVLIAEEIEARGGDIEAQAAVTSVDAAGGSVTLGYQGGGTLRFYLDNQTRLDDELGDDADFSLQAIVPGDFLEIEAGIDDNGRRPATRVKRLFGPGGGVGERDEILQGPVQTFAPGSSLTIEGVTLLIDGSTGFEDADDNDLGGSAAFFGQLAVGALVKMEDQDPADGTADEVEFED